MGEGRRSDLILCSGSVLLYVLGDHEGLLLYQGGHLDFRTALTLCCNVQISVLLCVLRDHEGLLLLGDSAKLVC